MTDVAGIAVTNIQPVASVVSGSAELGSVVSHDSEVPGLFGFSVKAGFKGGAASSVVKIAAGNVTAEVAAP